MGVPTKLVFYLIPILLMIAVVMVFWAQGGAWEDMKDILTGMKDKVYETVGFGTTSLTADVSISAEHQVQVNSVVSAINQMKGHKECFVNFGDFSELGERQTTISFEVSATGSKMVVMGGTQQVLTETFEGMTPCVIAGRDDYQVENFRKYYIEGESELNLLHYSDVGSVQFEYNDGGYFGFTANVIKVPSLGMDTSNNFNSNGWMYTPDGESYCFFPTSSTNDADGLSKKWFDIAYTDSIPLSNKTGKNGVVEC